MNTDPTRTSDRDRRLDEIVTAFLKAVEGGERPEPQAWLERYPDLAGELSAFFAGQRQVAALAGNETIGQPGGNGTLGRIRYIGDYELLEEIARGGMGVVYKARQVSLNRIVAVKMILKGELATAADVHRFRQEAQAAANLDHPNIVPIYEVSEHEGQQYFSMKLVGPGKRRAEQGLPETGRVVALVARAVHHAHQRGIMHRDLKPSNVLFDEKGEPCVADFGLAKHIAGEQASELTRSGAIVGTPSYMAPEQARAEKVLTTAVDVYSLGAILYEWTTGQPPFRGADAVSTMMQVIADEPRRPRSLNARIDRDLETICLKCLDKDPARRYGSAEALAEDLERWQRGEPIKARPATSKERAWRWCRRNPVVAGLVAAVMVSLVGGVAFSLYFAFDAMAREKATEKQRLKAVAAEQKAVENEETANRHALEAEREKAKALAYADESLRNLARTYVANAVRSQKEADPAGALAWLAEAARADANPLRQGVHLVRLSAALQQFPRLVQVYQHDTSYQPYQELSFSFLDAGFNPDGDRLVLARGANKKRAADLIDTASGLPVAELAVAEHSHEVFSPEGDLLVMVEPNKRDGDEFWNQRARLLNPLTGKPTTAPPLSGEVWERFQHFSPDGQLIVTGHAEKNARILQVWDRRGGKALTPPLSSPGNSTAVISPDNRRMIVHDYAKGGMSFVQIWDLAGGRKLAEVKAEVHTIYNVVFHRNGTLFSIRHSRPRANPASADDFGTHEDIVSVFRADTGELVRPPWIGQFATLSPDGTLAAIGARQGTLSVVDVASGKEVRTVQALHGGFAPNSRSFLAAAGAKNSHLWNLTDKEPIVLSGVGNGSSFSPDGRLLARPSENTLFLHDLCTQETVNLPHTGVIEQVLFSPRCSHFLVLCKDRTVWLWEVPVGMRTVRPPWLNPHGTYAWPVDDRQILLRDADGVLQLRDVWTGTPTGQPWHEPALRPFANVVSQSGRYLLVEEMSTAGDRRSWRVWDMVRGQRMGLDITVKAADFDRPQLNHDGTRLLAKSTRGLHVWDATTGAAIREVPFPWALNPWDASKRFQLSPSGRFVLLVAEPNVTMQLWDLTLDKDRPPLLLKHDAAGARQEPGDAEPAASVGTFSPDETRLLTFAAGKLYCWDTGSGALVLPANAIYPAKTTSYEIAGFSADKRRFVENGPDGFILRELATQKAIRVLLPRDRSEARIEENPLHWFHDRRPSTKFSARAGRLVSVTHNPDWSRDALVIVWDAFDGKQLTPVMHFPAAADALAPAHVEAALSDDGLYLATVSRSQLQIWEADGGQPLTPPLHVRQGSSRVLFSADARRLLIWSDFAHAEIIDLVPLVSAAEMFDQARRLSGRMIAGGVAIPGPQDELRAQIPQAPERRAGVRFGDAAARLAWHRRLADDALAEHLSFVRSAADKLFLSAFHLGVIIAAEPYRADLYAQRAYIWGQLGDWHRVVADTTRVLDLNRHKSLVLGAATLVATPPSLGQVPLTLAVLKAGSAEDARLMARLILDRVNAHAKLGQFATVMADLDRAVELDDARRSERADMLARLGKFREAEADFAARVALPLAGAWDRQSLALVRLALKDEPGYRQACSSLVKSLEVGRSIAGWSLAVADNARIIWTCVSRPDAIGNWPELARRLENAAVDEPRNADDLRMLGAAYHRAARHKDAINVLDRALMKNALGPGEARNLIFLALAHQAAGNQAEAVKWRDRAEKWLGVPENEPTDWRLRIEFQELRREMRERIK